MSNMESLSSWIAYVKNQARRSRLKELYEGDLLTHYEHVALSIFNSQNDITMAKAGFLHGVEDEAFVKACLKADYSEIQPILSDRWRALALDASDVSLPEWLQNEVLPTLDPRGLVLLVVESLHHADSKDVGWRFSRSFHTQPMWPPHELPTIRRKMSFDIETSFLKAIVAPVSEYLGLWAERNLAQDLALLREDRSRVVQLVEFLQERNQQIEVQRRQELIRQELRESDDIQVQWRWHHAASLDRRLRRLETKNNEEWRHKVSVAGRVIVECTNEQDCYAALGRLHLSAIFEPHERIFQDSMARPKLNGYRAIHTTLLERSERGEERTLWRVEIIPRGVHRRRTERLNRYNFEPLDKVRYGSPEKMKIFTPDGFARFVPAGARVLNLALQIHSDLVAWVSGALVNRRRVDLLHPLQPGDIVQFEKGMQPLLDLPEGWEDKVPSKSVRAIRHAYRRAVRKSREASGRQVILEELGRYVDYAHEIEQSTLDLLISECAAHFPSRLIPPQQDGGSWWREQFALHHPQQGGGKINDTVRNQFLQQLRTLIENSPRSRRYMVTMPPTLRESFDEMVMCEQCGPRAGDKVLGRIKGRVLIVHRNRCAEARDGVPIEWRQGVIRSQYFVIEETNRVGITSEVLVHVAQRGIDIIDLAGTSLGPSWAVVRFQVHNLSSRQVQELADDLRQIPGVLRVFAPGDPVPPVLEGVLPRREGRTTTFRKVINPYPAGPDIQDDAYFYGRTRELNQLTRLLEITKGRAPSQSRIVFVTGPLKVGKTSLLNKFCRDLRATDLQCGIVQVQCPRMHGWNHIAKRLHQGLVKEIEAVSTRRALSLPFDWAHHTLEELCDLFLHQVGSTLVFVIDEAISMMKESLDRNATESFHRFVGWIRDTPGALLVLAGPKSSSRNLPDSYQELLRGVESVVPAELTVREVQELLRAEKSGLPPNAISVPLRQAENIHRLTGGNPYWCNVLGRTILEKVPEQYQLTYSQKLVLGAQRAVLHERPEVFRDRFWDDEWLEEIRKGKKPRTFLRVIAAIITTLTLENSHQKNTAMSRNDMGSSVLRLLATSVLTFDEAIIEAALEELQDRGTINSELRGDTVWWKLSAPLLGEFAKAEAGSLQRLWRRE